MHIGFFTNNYLPNPYGVSASVEGFRHGLVSAGHAVSIFAPQWGKKKSIESNVYRYPSIDLATKVPFSLVVPYARKIDKKIDALDLDIIHAQHPNLLGAQAQRWAQKKNVPLIFTWHSLYDRYAHYASLVPEKFAVQWVMYNAIAFAEVAHHVITPTESVKKIVVAHGIDPAKISVVASGVDEDLFANPDKDIVRKEYGIPKNAPLLVSISRITEEKNVLFLAKSVYDVLTHDDDVYFVFAGEGNLVSDVKKIFARSDVKNRVFFPGRVDRADIKNYLVAADIFVYSSTSETQGTIITEAMYMGVPVVAVRSSGVEDLVVHGKTGVLVSEDGKLFARAVQKCLKQDTLYTHFGQNAHILAQKKYTVSACTKKLLAVYKHAIKAYEK